MDQHEINREIEHIIAPLICFWEISSEPWVVKNNLSQFVYANHRMHNFIGLPTGFNMEGLYDGELPLAMHEFEPQFQAHDRKVEQDKDRVTSVEVHQFDRKEYLQPWYSEKFPILASDGTSIGVIAHCRPVESIFITRLSKIKIPTSLMFTPPSELFSSKEWEVIFYICQQFTPKMIEAATGISNRTVEDMLSRIYKKSGVGNKRGLIDYCIEHGFNNFIPPSIFNGSDSILPFQQ